jgi:hypothetical protein
VIATATATAAVRQIEVDGTRLAYREAGPASAEPVVMELLGR